MAQSFFFSVRNVHSSRLTRGPSIRMYKCQHPEDCAFDDGTSGHIRARENKWKLRILVNDIEKVYALVARGEKSFEIDVQPFKGLNCLDGVAFVRSMVSWLTLATDPARISNSLDFFNRKW